MFHEALLTSEQPGWSIVRGVPLRALLGAAAVGACIGWTIALLPAPSAGLYRRVTILEDATPNPNGWFYTEKPGGVSDGDVQRKSWAVAGYPICGEGRAQSPIDIDTRHGNGPNARAIIERATPTLARALTLALTLAAGDRGRAGPQHKLEPSCRRTHPQHGPQLPAHHAHGRAANGSWLWHLAAR